METSVQIKDIRMSPKKLRFLLPAIKKMSPSTSLEHLFYMPKKGAKIFYKAIQSAITSAKQNLKVDENSLKFKSLTVDEGRRLKRYRPGSKGMAKPIKKKYAHIKITLTVDKKLSKVEGTKPNLKIKKTKKVKKDLGSKI